MLNNEAAIYLLASADIKSKQLKGLVYQHTYTQIYYIHHLILCNMSSHAVLHDSHFSSVFVGDGERGEQYCGEYTRGF